MPVAELKDISFSYDGGQSFVLRDVDFSIEEKEHVALIGHNGSGKSTLAKLVAGLLAPDSGEVRLFELLCFDDEKKARPLLYQQVRRHIAAVFQDPSDQLVSDTVAGDVAFGPQNLCWTTEQIDEAVLTQLEKAGIGDFAGRDPSTLSGGEQQLVAIASAISMRPDLLVLDEPSAFLDLENSKHLLRLIEKASAGISVLHVTHKEAEAELANRIVNIEEINK